MKTVRFFYKIFIITFLTGITLFLAPIYAQVSGYMGRRVLAKADMSSILLEEGYGLQAEVVLTRIYSLSISYKENKARFGDNLFANINIDSISVSRRTVGLALKRYLKLPITAPKGFYYVLSINQGTAKLYKRQSEEFINAFGITESIVREFNFSNVGYIQYGLGLGKQWIFLSRFVLDVSPVFIWDQYFANNHFIALDNFPSINPGNIPPTMNEPYSGVFSVSLNLGLGILLF